MHPVLSRLGVPPGVQLFFRPFYKSDPLGNLVFPYGNGVEHFGFAFHKVPNTDQLWMAGNSNCAMISDVFITGSAMDCIAFLALYPGWLKKEYNILFLSVGTLPKSGQVQWLQGNLVNKNIHLLFGGDLLGRIFDLKLAAALRGWPLEITVIEKELRVDFRHTLYSFNTAAFSLHAFEKAAGYRFAVRTHKPNAANTFLNQLMNTAFNI